MTVTPNFTGGSRSEPPDVSWTYNAELSDPKGGGAIIHDGREWRCTLTYNPETAITTHLRKIEEANGGTAEVALMLDGHRLSSEEARDVGRELLHLADLTERLNQHDH
jgi:hypothetical protein